MRKQWCVARAVAVAVIAAMPVVAAAQNPGADALQMIQDRQAIEALLARYSYGLDTLNADLYVSVFTDDAEFGSGDNVRRGHAKIREIITDLLATREKRKAAGEPLPGIMHHVLSNNMVEFVSKDEVRHKAYYMTVVTREGNKREIAAMGTYEDVIVKRNGKWLIKSRKLLQQ